LCAHVARARGRGARRVSVPLALCHERAGHLASAWVAYQDAVQRSKREGRSDREEAARAHLEAIEPKLSYLTIEVDESEKALKDLAVKRDGTPVGPAAWGTATPSDAGEHVIEATAAGRQPFRQSITIGAEADKQVVRIGKLPALAATAAVAPETPGPADPDGETSKMPPLRVAGLIVGGAGVVSLGMSAFFGLRAASLNGESKDLGCNEENLCPPNALSKREDAVTASTWATVTLIGGGVLAATGATLFILGGRHGESGSSQVTVTPVVGLGSAGILVQGSL
jgi:serine/threonine-protein kinase